jgi:uncharacterized protein (DUF924 family)
MRADGDVAEPMEVVEFWCELLKPEHWFTPPPQLDAHIRTRFSATHLALARGVPEAWRETPDARLAAVIVLDQFPRNMYRNSPLAFATDWIALREARLALEAGADAKVAFSRRHFFYLPFEHSEEIADQERSVGLFRALGEMTYLDYAHRHHAVIRDFGRFPHRNTVLGRRSTPAELDYLALPGSGF